MEHTGRYDEYAEQWEYIFRNGDVLQRCNRWEEDATRLMQRVASDLLS